VTRGQTKTQCERRSFEGDLTLRSPTGLLVVSGVGVTGTVRGRARRRLLLLSAVVGLVAVGLAVAGSGTLERALTAPENGEEESP
jgi:hypothetical protein